MSSRCTKTLKGLKYSFESSSKVPRGKAQVLMHPNDAAAVEEVAKDGEMGAELLAGARSKVAIGSAVVDLTFKMGAAAHYLETEGEDVAADRVKGKLGVTGSDASIGQVERDLEQARRALKLEEQELKNFSKVGKSNGDDYSSGEDE